MDASTVLAALALVVAIGTAVWSGWYSQRTATKLEFATWKRNELLAATSELIQLSTHRNAILVAAFDDRVVFRNRAADDPFDVTATGGPHPRHSVDQMMNLVERIRLIDTDLAVHAQALADAHQTALTDADIEYDQTGDHVGHLDGMQVSGAALRELHATLSDAFRHSIS